jgi:hypothetical protein
MGVGDIVIVGRISMCGCEKFCCAVALVVLCRISKILL